MKKLCKPLLSAVLICCLLCALCGSAFADTRTITVNATVGKDFDFSETIFDVSNMSFVGDCPGLMSANVTQGFRIFGTPSQAGAYSLQITVTKTSGTTDIYIVNINVQNAADGGQPAVVVPDDKKPVNDGKVTITKQPTGEAVRVGDTALFVARAENAESFSWGLYNPGNDEYHTAAQAQGYFAGLRVEVLGDASDTTLRLSNIPYSLNGWYAEVRFFGSDKEGNRAFSNGARISVTGDTLPTPRISVQPTGATLESGKTTTLTVTAASDAGANTLRYQWYKNDTEKNSGGTAITGATSSTYTPPSGSGTSYYYVNVWSTDGTKESTHVNSSAVAVSYPAAPATPAAPVPTLTPAGQTTGQGGQTAGQTGQSGTTDPGTGTGEAQNGSGSAPAAVVTTQPSAAPVSGQRSHTGVVVLILVLAAVLLAACATLFVLKRTGRD